MAFDALELLLVDREMDLKPSSAEQRAKRGTADIPERNRAEEFVAISGRQAGQLLDYSIGCPHVDENPAPQRVNQFTMIPTASNNV
jgi:hypothetical protein